MPYTPTIAGAEHANAGAAAALTGLYPSNVGSVGSSYVSETFTGTLYDFDPYAIMTLIHERHMRVSDFRFILKALGMSRGVKAPTTGHYERDWHYNAIKLGTTITASAGAGTSVVIALHADAMFAGGMSASASTVKNSDIKVGDILEFADGIQGYVSAKNTSTDPHRITVAPLDSTTEIASPTSGDLVAIVTNAFTEGSGLPQGRFPRISLYTNVFHIVKASAGVTGSNLTNSLFVQFPGTPAGSSIWNVVTEDMMAEFERVANGALLFGQLTDNVEIFNSNLEIDVPLKTTQGMLSWATDFGHTQLYTVGSYSLADFDAIGRTMTQERCPDRTFMTLDGYEIFIETENLLKDELGSDITPFLMKQIGMANGMPMDNFQPFENSDFDFYVGFKGVRKGGYQFAFKQLHEFSDVQGVGATGYNQPHWRVCVPIGSTRTNKADGSKGFAWGYEYKELNGYNREVVFGNIAGIGVAGTNGFVPQPVHANDYMQNGIVGEIAFHGACPNQSYIQKPDA